MQSCKLRAWDEPIVKDDINHLYASASEQDKSRLLAVTSHSSDWLHAFPIASCGLRLENEVSVLLLAYVLMPHSVKYISARTEL